MAKKKVLEAKSLWFRYPNSSWILRSLDLDVYEGETLLVIGRSGCGKTTLIRAIMGIGTNIYGGEIRGTIAIDGKMLEDYSIEELRKVIQIVNQDPRTHFIYPHVYEDLYSYSLQIYGDRKKAEEALDTVSSSLKIKHILNRLYFELSGGELRRVAIAKAMLSKPKIIIFDEPLMWLDDIGVKDFLDTLARLKSSGITIVIFEHRFIPLMNFVDRVQKFSDGSIKEVPLDTFRKSYLIQSENRVASIGRSTPGGREVAIIDSVWFRYDSNTVLKNISIRINENDAIAIYGYNGSGKSTLLKIIAGYLKPQKGSVKRFGKAIYIPQLVSLFFTEESVELELKNICRNSKDSKKCYSSGYSILKKYGFDDLMQTPFTLSWGQQEKLAVALSLAAGFNIFLLDEPFSGLTYTDRIALIEYLETVPGAKIVTISSSDSIPLLKGFKLYKLDNGSLIEYTSSSKALHSIDLDTITTIYSD
ncbi:MAG: ABC transporter ATP-binding protein [Ignisphaera sp.]